MSETDQHPLVAAQSLEAQGELEGAAAAYEAVLTNQNGPAEAHHNYARLLRRLERIDEAILQSRIAVDLSPSHPSIVFSHGLNLETAGRADEAIAHYQQSVALNPSHTPSITNLGRLLEQLGRPDEAVTVLEAGSAQVSDDAGILVNLANGYLGMGAPEKAIARASDALAVQPDLPAAHNAIGIGHYVQRQWTGAIEAFRQAIALAPDFAEAHENLALALLHDGQFKAGWDTYEWRWRNRSNDLTQRDFETPDWDGRPLDGRTLLLHGEQGFGDTLQFIRYANLVDKSGGRIVLACQRELVGLLSALPALDEVVVLGDEAPAHDCQAPLLGLPRLMGTTPATIPLSDAYLPSPAPEPAKLFETDPKALNIGITWTGRPRHTQDAHRDRSCPATEMFGLGTLANVRLFSLQTGREDTLPDGMVDLAPYLQDFVDTAEVIMSLDLVITIDTALAHLAGALGRPAIVALCYAADWRWGSGNGPAPWYPGVTMVRQESPGDWPGVVSRIHDMVAAEYLK